MVVFERTKCSVYKEALFLKVVDELHAHETMKVPLYLFQSWLSCAPRLWYSRRRCQCWHDDLCTWPRYLVRKFMPLQVSQWTILPSAMNSARYKSTIRDSSIQSLHQTYFQPDATRYQRYQQTTLHSWLLEVRRLRLVFSSQGHSHSHT